MNHNTSNRRSAAVMIIFSVWLILSLVVILIAPKAFAAIPPGCAGSNMAGPPTADAKCPVCYQREPANFVQTNPPIVTRVLNCAGDPNFILILQNVRGHDMDPGTCYIIQAGVHGITNGDPFGSETCNAAEAARVDNKTANPSAPASGGGGSTSTSGSSSSGSSSQNSNGAAATPPANNNIGNASQISYDKAPTCSNDVTKPACLMDYVNLTINVLSGAVGLVVVIMVIVGGIQYSAAGGDPQKVAKSKDQIRNSLLALFAFLFLYAFLQWVIPGGIL